ncbi:hypothetical protein AB0H00_22840 [Nocardia sp. NPDC023852]|uniref:hypothetical protein n=1 Tax=Nocardia sp. NPDC023852 TaxID=3154697 RepID=UPI0033F8CD25
MTQPPVLVSIATTAVGFAGVATVFTYIALLTQVTGFAVPAVSVQIAPGRGTCAELVALPHTGSPRPRPPWA